MIRGVSRADIEFIEELNRVLEGRVKPNIPTYRDVMSQME